MEIPRSMVLTLVSLSHKGARKSGIRADDESIDNENKDQTGYVVFVKALRTQFATDKSKQYYISAAPQCPLPDASIPVGAMQLMDFVVSNFPFSFFFSIRVLIWAVTVISLAS